MDKARPLRQVAFGVLNFPETIGNQSEWSTDGTLIPHVTMEVSGWRVELRGVPDIGETIKALREDSGYGLTYSGTVTRSNDAPFQVNDVKPVLEALRAFFMFARGSSCGIALVEGEDQGGQQSWVRWGAHYTEPWRRTRSWLRTVNNDDILSEIFPKFCHLLTSGGSSERVLLRAIDWYAQSNVNAPYIGLVLTLAAADLLSSLVLARERNDKEEYHGNFIKDALDKLQIPADLPESCEVLSKAGLGWKHGPHAVVSIRNDLIHPKSKLAGMSDYAIDEAWNLGQWYIEMMLLSMLGYQGNYVNRLAPWRDDEQAIPPVPWAIERQAT